MQHFRSKSDIIRWLEKHCPRKSIVRSLNNVELLGGFDPIPPTTRPGWIVRVTSIFDEKRKWIVAIIPHKGTPTCGIRILNKVPWKYWTGCRYPEVLARTMGYDYIYSGDKPWLYAALKEKSK